MRLPRDKVKGEGLKELQHLRLDRGELAKEIHHSPKGRRKTRRLDCHGIQEKKRFAGGLCSQLYLVFQKGQER